MRILTTAPLLSISAFPQHMPMVVEYSIEAFSVNVHEKEGASSGAQIVRILYMNQNDGFPRHEIIDAADEAGVLPAISVGAAGRETRVASCWEDDLAAERQLLSPSPARLVRTSVGSCVALAHAHFSSNGRGGPDRRDPVAAEKYLTEVCREDGPVANLGGSLGCI